MKKKAENEKKKKKMKLGVSKTSSSGKSAFHTTQTWDYFGFTVEIQQSVSNVMKGVLIGVIDTGLCKNAVCIERHQIKVRRCFAKRKRVTDSVDSVDDKNGHGTACASLAAGKVDIKPKCGKLKKGGMARGGAPSFDVGIFKVESLDDHIVAAAVDSALQEDPKVKLLSMSLSLRVDEPEILYSNTMSSISWRARENNVLVCASAGNLGRGGTILNEIPWLMCISGCNSPWRYKTKLVMSKTGDEIEGVSVNNCVDKFDYQVFVAKEKGPKGRIILKKGKVDGKIVMFKVSSYKELPKHEDITGSNAKGLIAISSDEKFQHWISPIPAIAITEEQGDTLETYLKKHQRNAKVKILTSEQDKNPDYAALCHHSPTNSTPWSRYINKPNACFHSELLAAIPQENKKNGQKYAINSGTSMATAAACGVAAHLAALYPEWSPDALMSAMMTTTDRMKGDSVWERIARGSGLINPKRSRNPGALYDSTPREYCRWLKGLGVEFGNEDLREMIDAYDVKPEEVIEPWNFNHAAFKTVLGDPQPGHIQECPFKRRLKYVGKGPARFEHVIENDDPQRLQIKVDPPVIEFEEPEEGEEKPEQSFTLTATVAGWNEEGLLFAEITWKNQLGDCHEVKSPILIVREA